MESEADDVVVIVLEEEAILNEEVGAAIITTAVPIINNITLSNHLTNSNNSSSVSFALQTARARSSKKCVFCSKTVYDMELIEVNQKYYHNYCFKCKQCKTNLSMFNFHSHKDNIYCATHYKAVLQAESLINNK